jgi:hypothetical protein
MVQMPNLALVEMNNGLQCRDLQYCMDGELAYPITSGAKQAGINQARTN